MVRYLFYTIGDLTYQSPLVEQPVNYDVLCHHNFKPPHALYYLAKYYSI